MFILYDSCKTNIMPFYAVKRGIIPGVYTSWNEAKAQVFGKGVPKFVVFKKFETRELAEAFMQESQDSKDKAGSGKGSEDNVVDNNVADNNVVDNNVADNSVADNNVADNSVADNSVADKIQVQEDEKTLICFTDGSATKNGKKDAKASYAVVWPYHEERNSAGLVYPATNNRGEFTGLIKGLEIADEIDPSRMKTLVAYTDSMLLINSVTKWLPKWQKNDYKTATGKQVANLDLVKLLEEATTKRKVILKHVKAHQKSDNWDAKYNNLADQLAQQITCV